MKTVDLLQWLAVRLWKALAMVAIALENSGLLKLAAIATRVSPKHSHKDTDHRLHRTILLAN